MQNYRMVPMNVVLLWKVALLLLIVAEGPGLEPLQGPIEPNRKSLCVDLVAGSSLAFQECTRAHDTLVIWRRTATMNNAGQIMLAALICACSSASAFTVPANDLTSFASVKGTHMRLNSGVSYAALRWTRKASAGPRMQLDPFVTNLMLGGFAGTVSNLAVSIQLSPCVQIIAQKSGSTEV